MNIPSSHRTSGLLAVASFAAEAHSHQTRQGGAAYIGHPLRVASRLADLGMCTDVVAAALLHDVIEDTDRTEEDIAILLDTQLLPSSILEIVKEVSEDQAVPKYVKKYQAYKKFESMSIDALLVKLADTCDNLSWDQIPERWHKPNYMGICYRDVNLIWHWQCLLAVERRFQYLLSSPSEAKGSPMELYEPTFRILIQDAWIKSLGLIKAVDESDIIATARECGKLEGIPYQELVYTMSSKEIVYDLTKLDFSNKYFFSILLTQLLMPAEPSLISVFSKTWSVHEPQVVVDHTKGDSKLYELVSDLLHGGCYFAVGNYCPKEEDLPNVGKFLTFGDLVYQNEPLGLRGKLAKL